MSETPGATLVGVVIGCGSNDTFDLACSLSRYAITGAEMI
jgi:hypothetical protein